MNPPITSSQIKDRNYELILRYLLVAKASTKAEIANHTGLSATSVSDLTGELIERGYLEVVGERESAGGRRPAVLKIRESCGWAMGISLEPGRIQLCALNLDGSDKIPPGCHVPIASVGNPVAYLIREIEKLMQGLAAKRLLGIGVSVPGFVDVRNGIVLDDPCLGWRNVHLKEQLERVLLVPVHVDRQGACGAVAEMILGAAAGTETFVYFCSDFLPQVGVVIEGEILRGVHSRAGHVEAGTTARLAEIELAERLLGLYQGIDPAFLVVGAAGDEPRRGRIMDHLLRRGVRAIDSAVREGAYAKGAALSVILGHFKNLASNSR